MFSLLGTAPFYSEYSAMDRLVPNQTRVLRPQRPQSHWAFAKLTLTGKTRALATAGEAPLTTHIHVAGRPLLPEEGSFLLQRTELCGRPVQEAASEVCHQEVPTRVVTAPQSSTQAALWVWLSLFPPFPEGRRKVVKATLISVTC